MFEVFAVQGSTRWEGVRFSFILWSKAEAEQAAFWLNDYASEAGHIEWYVVACEVHGAPDIEVL